MQHQARSGDDFLNCKTGEKNHHIFHRLSQTSLHIKSHISLIHPNQPADPAKYVTDQTSLPSSHTLHWSSQTSLHIRSNMSLILSNKPTNLLNISQIFPYKPEHPVKCFTDPRQACRPATHFTDPPTPNC